MKIRFAIMALLCSAAVLWGQNQTSVNITDPQIRRDFQKELVQEISRRQTSGAVSQERIGFMEDSLLAVVQKRVETNFKPGKTGETACHGAVGGRVFEADGVTPVNNIEVQVQRLNGSQIARGCTNSSGEYLFENVAGGDYNLYINGYTNSRQIFFPEYYDGATVRSNATVVTITDQDTTKNINFTLDRTGCIAGRVIDAGTSEPIEYMMVSIVVDGGDYGQSGFADADGNYEIYGLEAGSYTVVATGYKLGYGELFVPEYYNGATEKANANPISVSAGSRTEGIDFSLTRGFHVYFTSVPGEGGWSNVSPQKPVYAPGDEVFLIAKPVATYDFDHWSNDVSGTDSMTIVIMDADKYVNVHFTPKAAVDYVLTMEIYLGEGTTTPAVGTHTIKADSVVEIRAIPAEGYEFYKWYGDVADNHSQITTVTMNSSKTIKAKFHSNKVTLQMKVKPENSGTTVPAPGSYQVKRDSVILIEAIPAEDHMFDHWEGCVACRDSQITTVNMGYDKTVKAVFRESFYELMIELYAEDQGTTDPSPGMYLLKADTVITISAIPADDYKFVSWCGEVNDKTNPVTTVCINNHKRVKPKFEKKYKELTMQIAPESGGTTNPQKGVHIYPHGTVVHIEAMPAVGFKFVKWEGSVSEPCKAKTVMMLDYDKTVKAVFVSKENESHKFTIAVKHGAGGTTNPQPGTYFYPNDTTITIIATPDTGYGFKQWHGDAVDPYAAETQIVIDGDCVLKAEFKGKDINPPIVKKCFPVPGAQNVPKNVGIKMKVKDYDSGINPANVHVYVDAVKIISEGVDQTGGNVEVIAAGNCYSFIYKPETDFAEGAAVQVTASFTDRADPANAVDTTYYFQIGGMKIDTIGRGRVGQAGGVVASAMVEIQIPAGALEDSVEITISESDQLPELPADISGVAAKYHFGPDGLQFQETVLVKLPYTEADLAACGVEEPRYLKIMYYHTSTGSWTQLTVTQVDTVGHYIWVNVSQFCFLTFVQGATAVEDKPEVAALPASITLSECYPNPFNPVTHIEFFIAEPGDIQLTVMNTNGRQVRELIHKRVEQGHYRAAWNGLGDDGQKNASGLYFLVLRAGNQRLIRKVTFVK